MAVLGAALLGLVVWTSLETAEERAAQAERNDRIADDLEALAARLDTQTDALKRHAAALEVQADRLDRQTSRLDEQTSTLARRAAESERSRDQFRAAVEEILEALGATSDVFTEPPPSGGTSTSGGGDTSGTTSTDQPEPEPTMDNGRNADD